MKEIISSDVFLFFSPRDLWLQTDAFWIDLKLVQSNLSRVSRGRLLRWKETLIKNKQMREDGKNKIGQNLNVTNNKRQSEKYQ